jgi:hypothetical protein
MDYRDISIKLGDYIEYVLTLETPITGVTIALQKEKIEVTRPLIRFNFSYLPLPQQQVTNKNADSYRYTNVLCTISIIGDASAELQVMDIATRLFKYFRQRVNEDYFIASTNILTPTNGGVYDEENKTFMISIIANVILIN